MVEPCRLKGILYLLGSFGIVPELMYLVPYDLAGIIECIDDVRLIGDRQIRQQLFLLQCFVSHVLHVGYKSLSEVLPYHLLQRKRLYMDLLIVIFKENLIS